MEHLTEKDYGHKPVLLPACMDALAIRPDGVYVDGTLGRAGHSLEIARRLTAGGRLIGIDRDQTAIDAARERLAPLAARLRATLADEKQRVNLLVCMGLAGLLLLAVSSWLPADSSTQSAAPAAMTDSTADYAAELETRLTALISRVEGAGKTAVMVTLESGSESIYATDTDSDGSSTHVLLGSGGADGLVETVETPRVLGVAVVCEGGGSAAVQSRVTALVQALTGIGTNHITVAKMASAN